MSIVPFSWRDTPSLIEHILPAQKISAEAQKERKAGAGQTLTALGSYWKGRKPLILVKACILGALLPATDNRETDLQIFEMLMAIDDDSFLRRGFHPSCMALFKRLYYLDSMGEEAETLFAVRRRTRVKGRTIWETKPFIINDIQKIEDDKDEDLIWAEAVSDADRRRLKLERVKSFDYMERVSIAKRPEEVDQCELFDPVWKVVNAHLGTTASCMSDFMEQVGILRFGGRPKVGDAFCGGGSIPFEAARLGCNVYASDLNPVACMLTWGGLNIIGASRQDQEQIETAQVALAHQVNREIAKLGIECDSSGNRAKAYFYCLETRCPQTGWMIPVCSNWVISTNQNVVAQLTPDHALRRFNIEIVSGASEKQLEEAAEGTLRDGELTYTLDGETYRTKLKIIRGDTKTAEGKTANKLRRWEKDDFIPRPDDIFQERLYCIQWIPKETLGTSRQATFFGGIRSEDIERERKVEHLVRRHLGDWQAVGLVPEYPSEQAHLDFLAVDKRGVYRLADQTAGVSRLTC